MDYTWLDYIILLIFFLNIILGAARALLRELISIFSIIAALVVTIKFTVPLSDILISTQTFRDLVTSFTYYKQLNAGGPLSLVSFGVSFLVLFTGTYFAGEAVNYYATNLPLFVFFPFMTILERVIAAVIGFIRGYIFSLILILTLGLTPIRFDSGWTNSMLIPQLMPNAQQLGKMVRPDGFPVWSYPEN